MSDKNIVELLEMPIDEATQTLLESQYSLAWFFELRKKWRSDEE